MDTFIHHMPEAYIKVGGIRHYNVRCLNGSAHVKVTYKKTEVTCPLCLDENTAKDYWNQKPNYYFK